MSRHKNKSKKGTPNNSYSSNTPKKGGNNSSQGGQKASNGSNAAGDRNIQSSQSAANDNHTNDAPETTARVPQGGQRVPNDVHRDGPRNNNGNKNAPVKPLTFKTKNLSWAYYSEYYQDEDGTWLANSADGAAIKGRNLSLPECGSNIQKSLAAAAVHEDLLNALPGYGAFTLKTTYQGLIMGTGYLHAHGTKDKAKDSQSSQDSAFRDEIKLGFSFDYTTGLPYLPGSSVKGTIRSLFPSGDSGATDSLFSNKCTLVGALLAKASDVKLAIGDKDVLELRRALFDYGATFLDAFPCPADENCPADEKPILALDYITPHHGDEDMDVLADPVPLQMLKVRAGVPFEFRFVLPDSVKLPSEATLDQKALLAFLKEALLFTGVGAKTSTGYGRLAVDQRRALSVAWLR